MNSIQYSVMEISLASCNGEYCKSLFGNVLKRKIWRFQLKNPGYKLRAISPIVQSDANYSGVTVKHDPLKCEPNQWGKSLPTMLGFTKHAGLFVVKGTYYKNSAILISVDLILQPTLLNLRNTPVKFKCFLISYSCVVQEFMDHSLHTNI